MPSLPVSMYSRQHRADRIGEHEARRGRFTREETPEAGDRAADPTPHDDRVDSVIHLPPDFRRRSWSRARADSRDCRTG